MLRRRKMMMLSMTLRRKTDPKTGKHTLCEPARSKCTRTFHRSHFAWILTGQTTGDTSGDIVLCEPAQSKCTWTRHKSHFVWKFTGKMPDANPATPGHVTRGILCGKLPRKCRAHIPRQAFCASLHSRNAHGHVTKKHFVQKFTGKMSDASETTSIEHRASTVTVRTPQCGHTVWGVICLSFPPVIISPSFFHVKPLGARHI